MTACAGMKADEARDYKVVKKALLHYWYDVKEETHHRQEQKKRQESYRDWICWAVDDFDRWTKDPRDVPSRSGDQGAGGSERS